MSSVAISPAASGAARSPASTASFVCRRTRCRRRTTSSSDSRIWALNAPTRSTWAPSRRRAPRDQWIGRTRRRRDHVGGANPASRSGADLRRQVHRRAALDDDRLAASGLRPHTSTVRSHARCYGLGRSSGRIAPVPMTNRPRTSWARASRFAATADAAAVRRVVSSLPSRAADQGDRRSAEQEHARVDGGQSDVVRCREVRDDLDADDLAGDPCRLQQQRGVLGVGHRHRVHGAGGGDALRIGDDAFDRVDQVRPREKFGNRRTVVELWRAHVGCGQVSAMR